MLAEWSLLNKWLIVLTMIYNAYVTEYPEMRLVQILLNAKTEVFYSCKLHSVANWMHIFYVSWYHEETIIVASTVKLESLS
jgi:hypothetical protein